MELGTIKNQTMKKIKTPFLIAVFLTVASAGIAQERENEKLYEKNMDGMPKSEAPFLIIENEYNSTDFKLFQYQLHVFIYPHPVIDFANLYFELHSGGEISLEIFTLEGSYACAYNWVGVEGKNTYEADMRNLPIGNYLFVFSTPDGWVSGKLIKR